MIIEYFPFSFRFGGIRESKSYHDALDGNTNGLNDVLNNCNESEILSDTIELETETQTRHRLDSFYSATSVKSTYFSTGSISSYHSMDDLEILGKGMNSLDLLKSYKKRKKHCFFN